MYEKSTQKVFLAEKIGQPYIVYFPAPIAKQYKKG